MVETANEIGKSAASMRQANIEFGKSIEEAAENNVGCGDGGIKWIAEKVMQVVTREPLGANDIKRMKKNRGF
jgi:hypothetical protein